MPGGLGPDAPHLPHLAPIEAYGEGGFRFADMSHRGSILCLPSGIWAWPVGDVSALSEATLAPVFESAPTMDVFLIGAGRDPWALSEPLRALFHAAKLAVDCSATGPAVHTYNILVGEGRRVGAGLIAVA
jgi:uncharacterized protein